MNRIRLSSGRFHAYLVSQFLGAANDNAFKAAIVGLVLATVHDEKSQIGFGNLASFIMPIPFLLFSPLAGYLADRFPKHRVLFYAKLPEIVAMALGILGFLREDLFFLLGVFFLMSAQSAFFSPAKYGLLPEVVEDADLSMANGILNMTTHIAVLVGSVGGALVFDRFWGDPVWIGTIFTALACVGTVAVLGVPRGRPGNPEARAAWNLYASFQGDFRIARKLPVLFHSVVGLAYFSFLATIYLILIPVYGKNDLGLEKLPAQLLLALLAVGVGLGSVVAGKLSRGRVEMGLVPLGAVGMGLTSLDFLFFGNGGGRPWQGIPLRAALDLVLLGVSSGFYVVPLNALVQQRSPEGQKGRIIAFSNILTFASMLAASGFLWVLTGQMDLASRGVLLALSVITLAGTLYILRLLPDFFVRLVLWILTNTFYRIRVVGHAHLPRGGALFVANHVSWVDALLVGSASGRMVRFMMWRPYYEAKALNWFFRRMHVIPIASGDSPRKTVQALDMARREIGAGHAVCIFAEGSISRTGNLLKFKKGFERIVEGLDCPIVPVCLDGVWGSIFSYEQGKVLLKRPKRIPYPVTVLFGPPLAPTSTAFEVRQAVQDLSTEAFRFRKASQSPLHVEFLRTAKRLWGKPFVADSVRQRLSFGQALAAGLGLRDALFSGTRGVPENIGILLPPGAGGVLANLATFFAGKVPVNLNYTASGEAVRSSVEQAAIRRVVTSRKFIEKLGEVQGLEGVERIHLEEAFARVSKTRSIAAAIGCRLLPWQWAARLFLDGDLRDIDRTATILFSSGSTGNPKGVVLSHHNVLSNLESLRQVFHLEPDDCVLGVLPFFHSFGFTGALWLPAVAGIRAAYHGNPLDARTVGKLSEEHGVSILLATPTFLSSYTKRVEPRQFARLRRVVVGAEKLTEPVRKAFAEKYGVEPLEGYGCTECAPIVSVNIPDFEEGGTRRQTGNKPGTIGQPLPGISVRIVDPETRKPLPPGVEGMLWVKGPNVMQGYLGDPERTATALQDGWYVTGDIAKLDEDGFLTITDRLARFAKIGGEMVPLGKIEEAIVEVATLSNPSPPDGGRGRGEGSVGPDVDGPAVCVTSVPDEKKGERIVVLYRKGALDPKAVAEKLAASGLPNLWLPRAENFKEVGTIPLLGTGKIDLRKARELAK